MTRHLLCIAAVTTLVLLLSVGNAFGCSNGQVDVLTWMVGTNFLTNPAYHMGPDSAYTAGQNGFTGTPVYPYLWSGEMWWSRYQYAPGYGYAWDASTYDSNAIYFAYTNSGSGVGPDNYRVYYDAANGSAGYFYPAAPRCVTGSPTQGQPYSNSTIILSSGHNNTPNDTQYEVVSNCSKSTYSLGGAEFQLWPPVQYTFPHPMYGNENLGSHKLMALTYRYALTSASNYSLYGQMETFYYDQTYGWVAWTHQNWDSNAGSWSAPDFWDYMDEYIPGQLQPAQPDCKNS